MGNASCPDGPCGRTGAPGILIPVTIFLSAMLIAAAAPWSCEAAAVKAVGPTKAALSGAAGAVPGFRLDIRPALAAPLLAGASLRPTPAVPLVAGRGPAAPLAPLPLPAAAAPAPIALAAAPAPQNERETVMGSLSQASASADWGKAFDNSAVDPGVKACGVHDGASVLAALSAARSAGADNLIIGLLVGITHHSPDKVRTQDASGLVREIRGLSRSLEVPARIAFVTHHVRARALIDMVRRIARRGGSLPDIIQIHDAMPLPEIARVKKALPGSKIIKALHVPRAGEAADLEGLLAGALELASQPFIDGLLLDTANPALDQIGGTGLTNDWDLARRIIDLVHERTGKPVALAGGLTPENATQAMERTGADMFDANSGFRLDRGGPNRSAPKDAAAIYSVLRQMQGRLSPYFRGLL